MLIRLEPSSGRPLHEQLTAQIHGQIATGRVGPGERLPSARELAEAGGVNVHTVLRSYQALRDAGVIDLRRGRGAVVLAHPNAVSPVHQAVDGLVAAAKAAGLARAEAMDLLGRAWR